MQNYQVPAAESLSTFACTDFPGIDVVFKPLVEAPVKAILSARGPRHEFSMPRSLQPRERHPQLIGRRQKVLIADLQGL